MAQNQQQVTCPAGTWTQLTNADAANITFQAQDGDIFIRYTTDATTPTEAFGFVYLQGTSEQNAAINTRTSLVGADRVWARPIDARSATVYVDHA